MTTTIERSPVWDKVDALERYDYTRYISQVEALSQEDNAEIMADWRLYRRAFLWIIEKGDDGVARPIRFSPRGWQKWYENARTNFDIVLKSRKTGCTTDVLTEMYAKSATREHQREMFMSYEDGAAAETALILQTAHEMNPLKPTLSNQSSELLVFSNTRSRIRIATAGAKVLARGSDYTMLHMTEVSHFYKKVEHAENFMAGALDAVARSGRVVQEATPNGEDPIFYPTWQAAKNGELWNPIFLSLLQDESADWGADNPQVLHSTANEDFELSDYERGLVEQAHASRGHLRFLRFEKQKLRALSRLEPTSSAVIGDERILLQEYPLDDVSCWLLSEETVFSQEMVHLYRSRRVPPMWVEESGTLRIWERAITGRPYVIFVDTSEGLPQSNWQAAAVLDVERLKFVAILRAKTDLPELSRRVYDLALSYNEALLMIERNNHGHAVLYILQETLHYPNLYYHDEATSTSPAQLGWPTNARTKPLMVTEFKELFEAGALEIHDEDALREIATFRHYDSRQRGGAADRYRAPQGGTDDIVMTLMGAVQGRHLAYAGTQAKPVRYGSIGSEGTGPGGWKP